MSKVREQILAEKIERYWKNRGYQNVKVEVIQMMTHHGFMVNTIRSNMVNGMPVKGERAVYIAIEPKFRISEDGKVSYS